MNLRQLLEQYFTDYPTCSEDERAHEYMALMTDADFAAAVIRCFETLKADKRRLAMVVSNLVDMEVGLG